VSVIYKYSNKYNSLEFGGQRAELNDFGLELKYNKLDKGSITGKVNFISISYNDAENSPVAYEMLNALRIGYNYTWGISYQRNLTSNLQITINYDGRKSPTSGIVNIGGAQVRAFF
jgi:hypothetical protein